MSRRFLIWVGVIAVAAVAVGVLRLVSGGGTPAGRALETPWGEPDIQGIWSDEYHIPIERAGQYGDRVFLTDAEVAALDRQRAAAPRFGDVDIAARGSEADLANAYNAFWYTTRHTGRQTSLIVDPPDGKFLRSHRRSKRGGMHCASTGSHSSKPRTPARTNCPNARVGSTDHRHRGSPSRLPPT